MAIIKTSLRIAEYLKYIKNQMATEAFLLDVNGELEKNFQKLWKKETIMCLDSQKLEQ